MWFGGSSKACGPRLRLTMPALETLAVIAYRQPVTGPEIQEIRGVNVSGVIKTLLEKRLIVTAGRKAVMGRPIMYRSSKEFLMRFGLSDLEELPSLKEFEQLARAALGSDEGIAAIEPEEGMGLAEFDADGMTTSEDISAATTVAEMQTETESAEISEPPAGSTQSDMVSEGSPVEAQAQPESSQLDPGHTEPHPHEHSKAESAS